MLAWWRSSDEAGLHETALAMAEIHGARERVDDDDADSSVEEVPSLVAVPNRNTPALQSNATMGYDLTPD